MFSTSFDDIDQKIDEILNEDTKVISESVEVNIQKPTEEKAINLEETRHIIIAESDLKDKTASQNIMTEQTKKMPVKEVLLNTDETRRIDDLTQFIDEMPKGKAKKKHQKDK